MKRKFNRFGVTGWFFMLGLTVSAFVLVNISDMVSRIQKENAGVNNYSYSRILWVRPMNDQDFSLNKAGSLISPMINALCEANCNTSFYDLPIYVNNQIDFMQMELIINGSENVKFKNQDNKMVKPEMENALYIGESILRMTDNRAGKMLDLGNVKAPIAEILKNNNAAKIDYSICAFWVTLDDEFKEYLSKQITERLHANFLEVRFFGDTPIDESIRKFSDKMNELSLECEENDFFYNGRDARNYWYQFYNGLLLPICMVFGFFVCFSTSYLWVMTRKNEISIRKAYGYSNAQILSVIIKDGLFLALPALGAAIAAQLVFCAFLGDLDYFDIVFPLKLLFVCAGMLTITLICALRLTSNISKISPAVGLKEV